MSNVFVLQRALELAGHEVTCRPVSLLEDPCIEDDFDAAIVGIAACQGLSSRFKLGACWALHRFGSRAGIFPSDGRNVYTFPSSVKTCLTGVHKDGDVLLDPIDYFLGYLQRERNNTLDAQLGADPQFKEVWRNVLCRLPHDDRKPLCAWPILVPTFAWGNPDVYQRHFGGHTAMWDPTNVAIPMQFPDGTLGPDGRLPFVHEALNHERTRSWVLSSLQDQGPWVKKQSCKWPVITVGNKRLARGGGMAVDYVPELELIDQYYRTHWGHLAFGYPLAEGGWWRMRYVHAALAGIVTCTDENDARRMPDAYRHPRSQIERYDDAKLASLAREQHVQLGAASWPVDRAVAAVDAFVRGLK